MVDFSRTLTNESHSVTNRYPRRFIRKHDSSVLVMRRKFHRRIESAIYAWHKLYGIRSILYFILFGGAAKRDFQYHRNSIDSLIRSNNLVQTRSMTSVVIDVKGRPFPAIISDIRTAVFKRFALLLDRTSQNRFFTVYFTV